MEVNIPYIGPIDGGLSPGKMVRIQGSTPNSANRFAINIQTGPGLHPRDDIVLHISPIFAENVLSRASLQGGIWGPEERSGALSFTRGQPFEIVIRCEQAHFEIMINREHFTDFEHRMPFLLASQLVIEGDVIVTHIGWEGGVASPSIGFAPHPTPMYPPVGGVQLPYPTTPAASGALYTPPPVPSSAPVGYGYTPAAQGYGQQAQAYQSEYPPPPPGCDTTQPIHKSQKGGMFDKLGATGGALLDSVMKGKSQHGHSDPNKSQKSHKSSGVMGMVESTLGGVLTKKLMKH